MSTSVKPIQVLRWGVPDAAITLALAIVGVVGILVFGGLVSSQAVVITLGYVVVWIPLLGGVCWASFVRGQRSLTGDFGLAFRWVDLVWGLVAALLLRSCVPFLESAAYGTTVVHGANLMTGLDPTGLILFLLASVVIAPLIEELYFRGLLLRAIRKSTVLARLCGVRPASAFMSLLAVVATAIAFAGVHLIGETSLSRAFVTGVSALLVGVVTAILAIRTGRLGPGIVTHSIYNVLIIVPAMAWWS